jgi:hypothetical protein
MHCYDGGQQIMLSSVLVLVGVHLYVLCNGWFDGATHCFRLGNLHWECTEFSKHIVVTAMGRK